jgi:hypothetical protein
MDSQRSYALSLSSRRSRGESQLFIHFLLILFCLDQALFAAQG